MSNSRQLLCVMSTIVTLLFSNLSFAADGQLTIPRIQSEPTLADFSGMKANTELARSMTQVQGFTQRNPDDGDPASQRTEVYMAYDQERLYAIYLAFDTDPNAIRATMSSRENFGGDDYVELTIDTFNSQRTAFSFRTTPYGIQWDARWTEGSSFRGGFDTTLQAVWDSDGELTDQGYMVRMSIPLRSLRFPDMSDQTWRIQFGRYIPRLSESAYWPAYSLAIEGRLNQTELMTGISDVSPGNNSQFIPYIFARELDAIDPRATGGPQFDKSSEQELGLDAKFVFNDSMVLDLTLNPDFSQIESDQPQVTVNERFEVMFPENRPFFVENADFFSTSATLLFTRRIADPEGGARFTGRTGNWGFGSLLVNDEAPGLNRAEDHPLKGEKADIAVLRGFRDIGEQNRVGFFLSDRELADGYNRVASVDGRFKINDNWVTEMQVIGTETEPSSGGEAKTGYQRTIQLNRAGRTLTNHTHFEETTEDFETQLGFQTRYSNSDTSGLHQRNGLTFYPENSKINSWGGSAMLAYQEDMEGTKIYDQISPALNMKFSTTGIGMGWNGYTEILRPEDFPGIVTNQSYDYDNWSFNFSNNSLDSLDFGFNFRTGTALNLVPPIGSLPDIADSSRYDVNLLWKPIDRLRIDNTYLYTELESRNGGGKIFSNEIFRSNWNYQFTREWSLRFIAQYEQTDAGQQTRLVDDENLNFDILLRYVINPWSAFYLGYNSNQSNFDIIDGEEGRELIVTDDLQRDGDQFFFKVTYLFQR